MHWYTIMSYPNLYKYNLSTIALRPVGVSSDQTAGNWRLMGENTGCLHGKLSACMFIGNKTAHRHTLYVTESQTALHMQLYTPTRELQISTLVYMAADVASDQTP